MPTDNEMTADEVKPHSSTPWNISGTPGSRFLIFSSLLDFSDKVIATTKSFENAEFIVRAANDYDRLHDAITDRERVIAEKDKEIERLKEAAEMEFQRADGKAEMKRYFQEQLVLKDTQVASLQAEVGELKAAASKWHCCCDSEQP